jgi:GGDEF domain-containing protein
MSTGRDIPTATRARAVAELPIEAIGERGAELAKRWAVALILARPLPRIAEIPLEELAREGPSLCTQALRALQSDAELGRLTGSGPDTGRESSAPARRLAAVTGAADAATAVSAVESLRGVLWESLLGELREPSARELGDAGDRLAYVCSCILAVAVAELEESRPGPDAGEEEPGPAPVAPARPDSGRTVIIDELAGASAPVGGPREILAEPPEPPEPPEAPEAEIEIEIRDERGWDGPAAWIGSIGRQLERYGHDGLPFAVMLVEIAGFERLHAQRSADAERLGEDVERLLAAELRALSETREATAGPSMGALTAAGSFTRERPGRYWMLAPRTDRHAAERLAEALAREIRAAAAARWIPAEVAIGTASCPADGREAPALAAHADVALYAARAAARATGPAAGGSRGRS